MREEIPKSKWWVERVMITNIFDSHFIFGGIERSKLKKKEKKKRKRTSSGYRCNSPYTKVNILFVVCQMRRSNLKDYGVERHGRQHQDPQMGSDSEEH